MKLAELTTPYETHKVVMYGADGYKVVYHNKKIRHVCANIYAGEPYNGGYNTYYAVLYALYDGLNLGLYIGTTSLDNEADDVVRHWPGYDTADVFLANMQSCIDNNDHVRLTDIEFIKHFKPEMEQALWNARNNYLADKEKRAQERREKDALRKIENTKQNRAALTEQIKAAIDTIKNGGTIINTDIVFYIDDYHFKRYAIVDYLMRLYGIKDIPIRTRGFIINSLTQLNITPDGAVSYRYWKSGRSKGSQVLFDYLYRLVHAVRESEDKEIIVEVL